SGLDLGTIVMDSIFSPVIKVGYRIDNVRVGKRTDYEKLTMTIETDGTIFPWQAFIQAAELLNSQFKFLKETMDKKGKELEKEIVAKKPAKKKATKRKKTTKKKK
ncbi:MAG: DNA-directed RNA polymerase subunit alpha, partial [Minisyncoccia bacterium]